MDLESGVKERPPQNSASRILTAEEFSKQTHPSASILLGWKGAGQARTLPLLAATRVDTLRRSPLRVPGQLSRLRLSP